MSASHLQLRQSVTFLEKTKQLRTYKRNIEERSCNHRCGGKAVSHILSVLVASVT